VLYMCVLCCICVCCVVYVCVVLCVGGVVLLACFLLSQSFHPFYLPPKTKKQDTLLGTVSQALV